MTRTPAGPRSHRLTVGCTAAVFSQGHVLVDLHPCCTWEPLLATALLLPCGMPAAPRTGLEPSAPGFLPSPGLALCKSHPILLPSSQYIPSFLLGFFGLSFYRRRCETWSASCSRPARPPSAWRSSGGQGRGVGRKEGKRGVAFDLGMLFQPPDCPASRPALRHLHCPPKFTT